MKNFAKAFMSTFGCSGFTNITVKVILNTIGLLMIVFVSASAHANVQYAGSNMGGITCDSSQVFPDVGSLLTCAGSVSAQSYGGACPDNTWTPNGIYSYSGNTIFVIMHATIWSPDVNHPGTCISTESDVTNGYIGGAQTTASVNSCAAGFTLQNNKCVISGYKQSPAATHNANYNSCKCGDPTDVATGENVREEQDIPASPGGVLSFTRYYSNQTHEGDFSDLGPGWRDTYSRAMDVNDGTATTTGSSIYSTPDSACTSGWSELTSSSYRGLASSATASYTNGLCQLTLNGTVISKLTLQAGTNGPATSGIVHTITRPDGSAYVFEQNGSGLQERYGAPVTLAAVTDGWLYTDKDGTQEHYNNAGQLTTITDRVGHIQTLSYNSNGQLTTVSDSYGRQLLFTYNSYGLLASVTDPNGGVYSYDYDSVNRLADVRYPDKTPTVISDNPKRRFYYNDNRFPFALTRIYDEKNVLFATWTYDAQQRVLTSEHAGGEGHIDFTYNADGSTTLHYANGGVETFHFSPVNGSLKVTSVTHQ